MAITFRRRLAFAAAALPVCAGVAGCGIGGPSGPPAVSVAMIAPSPGATVNVRSIEVLGNVDPHGARVVVDGHRVRAAGGVFRDPLVLHRRLTRIKIQASAKGFASTSTVVSVGYARPASSSTIATDSGAGPGGASASVPSVSVPSVSVPATSLQQEASSSCVASGGDVGLCTCVFSRLTSEGFNTEAHWEALVEDWRKSLLANGSVTYPPVILNAIKACAGQ